MQKIDAIGHAVAWPMTRFQLERALWEATYTLEQIQNEVRQVEKSLEGSAAGDTLVGLLKCHLEIYAKSKESEAA